MKAGWKRWGGVWTLVTGDGFAAYQVALTDEEARAFARAVLDEDRPLAHEAVAAMEAG